MSKEEFSVCQFFENGSYEYVRRCVGGEEAVRAFGHYCTSVGARLGTTVRVIVTDGGDCTNMEWKREEGVTYPPDTVLTGKFKMGVRDVLEKR